jgi:exopolysaccharide production protein ExoQ
MELVEKMDRPNLLSLTNTWILCAILLVFASLYGFSFERGSTNTFLGADVAGLAAGNQQEATIIKVQNIAVYILSALCILPFIQPVWRRVRENAPIFLVLGWAMLSVLWSDMPSTTAVNALRMAINLALVIYLFERYSSNDIQKLMMLVGCVAAAGSIFLVFVFPRYGLQSRGLYALGAWEGIFGQKNICGLEMLMLLLPAFFVKLEGAYTRILRGGYIVIVLGIIAMTRSAGAWVVTALCLGFVGLLQLTARMRRKDAVVVALGAAAAAAIVGLILVANYDAFMQALDKDPTMTGRTVLWAGLVHIVMKRPMLGYGYMAFWQGLNGPSRYLALMLNWPGLGDSESGVMEMLLELGIVGLLLYLAVFARAVKDGLTCFSRGASAAALWYISILFFVVATNIEGGLLLAPSNLTCILPFVAFVGLRREAKRLHERQIA